MMFGLPMIASIMICTSQEPVRNQRVCRVTRLWRNQSEPFSNILSGANLAVNERMGPNRVKGLELRFRIIEALSNIESLSQRQAGPFTRHPRVHQHKSEYCEQLCLELWAQVGCCFKVVPGALGALPAFGDQRKM